MALVLSFLVFVVFLEKPPFLAILVKRERSLLQELSGAAGEVEEMIAGTGAQVKENHTIGMWRRCRFGRKRLFLR